MARFSAAGGTAVFGLGLLVGGLLGAPARAQVPVPMSSNPAEITACLCQQQGVATLSADMSARTQALAAARQRVADLDAQLLQARQHIDVNNADSEARYKALLAQRDQAYQASIGPVVGEADQATARYNAHVSQYNSQCANRMFDSVMMAQIQAHLACPPLQ
jgi:Tfp pilus assembly protein FimV